jgi:hypothetical protein
MTWIGRLAVGVAAIALLVIEVCVGLDLVAWDAQGLPVAVV